MQVEYLPVEMMWRYGNLMETAQVRRLNDCLSPKAKRLTAQLKREKLNGVSFFVYYTLSRLFRLNNMRHTV